MKSIRLNKTIRSAIAENIRNSWIEANPSPENPSDPVQILYEAAVKCHFEDPRVKATLKFAKTEAGKSVVHMDYDLGFRKPDGQFIRIYAIKTKDGKEILVEDGYNYRKVNEGCEYINKFVYTFQDSTCDFHNEDFLKANPIAAEAVKQFNKARKENHKKRQAFSAWETKRDNYMQQVEEVLGAVNTTGQLIEQWEEVAKFIPDGYRNPSKIALPSVSVKSLQAELE